MLGLKGDDLRNSEPVANAEYNISIHFLLILSFWSTFMESMTTLLSWVEANSIEEEVDIV
jgi:hypothetical protein